MEERLQKILSACGIASRRKAEEYITRGLVTVNGKVATLGQKADPEKDEIAVDGKVLEERAELLYYLLHKPVGIETSNIDRHPSLVTSQGTKDKRPATSDQVGTVRDLLPKELQGKIYPVGRLDKDTSGLLIMTNDGVLSYRLTHPKFDHEKEYEVVTEHPIPDGALRKLEQGITIDGTKTKPAKVRRLGPSSFCITLTEGRNRQIRRMCQKVGSPVRDLRRVRIMTIKDTELKPGKMRELTPKEVAALLAAIGL